MLPAIQNVPAWIEIAKSALIGDNRFIALLIVVMAFQAPSTRAEPYDATTINRAFSACCNGYSSDELLIRDDLRQCFLAALSVDDSMPMTAERETVALLRLLQMRKAGKLISRATRQGSPVDESVFPIAEIAARVVTDRHRITSDTMLAAPNHRRELQREAVMISPGVDPYAVRKAVLALRKKRALRPELVLQVADWGRRLQTLSMRDLRISLKQNRVPTQPGVYLFRSAEGYLYVGETSDLAARLRQHTTASDRRSLAEYLTNNQSDVTVELHIFPADSPARKVNVRRAYESELIRSRQPRFNVRP